MRAVSSLDGRALLIGATPSLTGRLCACGLGVLAERFAGNTASGAISMSRLTAWLFTGSRCALAAKRCVAPISVYSFAIWLRRKLPAGALATGLLVIARATLLRTVFGPGLSPNRCLGAGVHVTATANP